MEKLELLELEDKIDELRGDIKAIGLAIVCAIKGEKPELNTYVDSVELINLCRDFCKKHSL